MVICKKMFLAALKVMSQCQNVQKCILFYFILFLRVKYEIFLCDTEQFLLNVFRFMLNIFDYLKLFFISIII